MQKVPIYNLYNPSQHVYVVRLWARIKKTTCSFLLSPRVCEVTSCPMLPLV